MQRAGAAAAAAAALGLPPGSREVIPLLRARPRAHVLKAKFRQQTLIADVCHLVSTCMNLEFSQLQEVSTCPLFFILFFSSFSYSQQLRVKSPRGGGEVQVPFSVAAREREH